MTHLQYSDYFRNLAESHNQIAHSKNGGKNSKSFFRTNVFEFDAGLRTVGKFPCLALEAPTSRLSNNWDAPGEYQNGAFTIWDKCQNNQDATEEEMVLSRCKEIGLECIAKMKEDIELARSQNNAIGLLQLNLDSVRIQKVGPYHSLYHGYRFQFEFYSPLNTNTNNFNGPAQA